MEAGVTDGPGASQSRSDATSAHLCAELLLEGGRAHAQETSAGLKVLLLFGSRIPSGADGRQAGWFWRPPQPSLRVQPGSQRNIDSAALQNRPAAAACQECKINRGAPWEKREFLEGNSWIQTLIW